MRHLLIVATLLLAACQPKIINKPIPVPCVTPEDIPAPVPPLGTLPEDARSAADVLAALVLELRAVDREMRAILEGCR